MLVDALGREFEGVLGSDCFPAYLQYRRVWSVLLHLCLAHPMREVRFPVAHPDPAVAAYGERGRKWCERIRATIATCAQQGRSVYRFLINAVREHFAGDPAPSLLPQPP